MSSLFPSTFQAGVWKNAPLARMPFDPLLAVDLADGFTAYNAQATTGDWVSTQATAGTAATSTAFPGSLLLDAGSTTANQGIQIQRTKAAFVPAAGKSLWFETKLRLTAATPPVTRAIVFAGLAEADTTLFASGSLSTANHIGWAIQTTELLALTFRSEKASAELTRPALTVTPAVDFTVGFHYSGIDDTVQQYVNGVATGAVIPTANIPTVALYPSFACLSDSTDRPNLIVQGYRVVQLR